MDIEQQVHGDDRGYLTWAAAHPVGYVINVQRNLNPSDARLHRADCYTINNQPARGKSWTGPARPRAALLANGTVAACPQGVAPTQSLKGLAAPRTGSLAECDERKRDDDASNGCGRQVG